jgi:alpha-tubulin suppressor-like RCC1 family protein
VACWGPDDFGWAGAREATLKKPESVKSVTDATSVFLPGPASHQVPGAHCVIHGGGAVSCTGANEFGNVDIESEHDLIDGEMRWIEGLTDAIQIAGTLSTTCALRANGQVVCWGSNTAGLLGIGSYQQPEDKVVRVIGLENVVHIAGARWHMCAALGSGGVACWGANQEGQLGDGTTEDRAAPVPVLELP